MSNNRARVAEAPTTDKLRQTFEAAISKLQQNTKPLPRSRMPIAARPGPRTTEPNDPTTEKQALIDAARALARLWNVSPTLVR